MCARVLVQRATGLLLIFAASKQDNLASAQVPASCEKALQDHAGDSQLLELRLSNGDKLRGHIVRATDSNVSLESNKKDKSTREIQCSQIESYLVRRNSHWVRWTIIGVVIIVGVVGVVSAMIAAAYSHL